MSNDTQKITPHTQREAAAQTSIRYALLSGFLAVATLALGIFLGVDFSHLKHLTGAVIGTSAALGASGIFAIIACILAIKKDREKTYWQNQISEPSSSQPPPNDNQKPKLRSNRDALKYFLLLTKNDDISLLKQSLKSWTPEIILNYIQDIELILSIKGGFSVAAKALELEEDMVSDVYKTFIAGEKGKEILTTLMSHAEVPNPEAQANALRDKYSPGPA